MGFVFRHSSITTTTASRDVPVPYVPKKLPLEGAIISITETRISLSVHPLAFIASTYSEYEILLDGQPLQPGNTYPLQVDQTISIHCRTKTSASGASSEISASYYLTPDKEI